MAGVFEVEVDGVEHDHGLQHHDHGRQHHDEPHQVRAMGSGEELRPVQEMAVT